jgi:hypothetical protein
MEPKKSIFASKTFWFNLASTVLIFSGTLPPSKGVLIAATAANIGLRMITSQAVTLLPGDTNAK